MGGVVGEGVVLLGTKSWRLVILVKGIFAAAKSVAFVILLLSLILYVFAIILRQLVFDSDIGQGYFRSVPVGSKGHRRRPECAKYENTKSDLMFSLCSSTHNCTKTIFIRININKCMYEFSRKFCL